MFVMVLLIAGQAIVADFDTKPACEAAAQTIVADLAAKLGSAPVSMSWCLPSALEETADAPAAPPASSAARLLRELGQRK
jgi:hypothetical protein